MKTRRSNPDVTEILRGAVESASEGFVTIDQDHRVMLFNRAAEKIFGYRREEVLGKDLNTILSPGCSQDHRAAVERYLRARRARVRGHPREMVAMRKGGRPFPCAISFSVYRSGGRVFFTGIVRDLSEAKALEKEMAKQERLAELGRMVAEINHEIKNPLMIIGGLVRRLSRSTGNGRARNHLAVIASEVQRLENLLEELRRVYLPRKLRLRTFDLNALLRDVREMARESCRERGIRVTWTPDPAPLFVKGDRERLMQVFLNLVRNAVEAMGCEGDLRIATSRAGDRVSVAIEDTGPGIPDKVQARVFDPFFTTKKGGTGLGLPLCRRIVEDHKGGAIHMESREGGGTTVRISLPLVRPPSRSATRAKAAGD